MSDPQPDPQSQPATMTTTTTATTTSTTSTTATATTRAPVGRGVLRRLLMAGAIVLAALGAIAIRVVVEGRAAVDAGDAAATAGRPIDAIDHYETGARWYLPLAPHVDDAYARLRKLASSDNRGVSLAAWRAIRSSARATRSLWTPHADDLAAADAAIARLSARDPAAGELGDKPAMTASPKGSNGGITSIPDNEAAAREAWHRDRLARDIRPGVGVAAVAGLGIVLWLVGAWVLVARGLDRRGAWVRRPALIAAGCVVLGLALWFVGLYNA